MAVMLTPIESLQFHLYHDASEVLTGDLPTPVKYFNKDIAKSYKEIERVAEQKILEMVPEELQAAFAPLITQEDITAEEKAIVKAADTLSAYIKTLEEIHAGNHEFLVAKKRLEKNLQANQLPEVKYFLRTFVPSYSLSLDEITANSLTPLGQHSQD